MLFAEELISSGGPTAPVWAFLIAISTGVLTLIGQQLSAKRVAKETDAAAREASEQAQKAVSNTQNVANGFVTRIDKKLDRIVQVQQETNDSLRAHLEWHLEQSGKVPIHDHKEGKK